MAVDITMPKLSDTMTEGRLIAWKKSVGEQVHRGEIIAEVETDKANMELEAFTSGVLLQTYVKPGDQVAVGTVIALALFRLVVTSDSHDARARRQLALVLEQLGRTDEALRYRREADELEASAR